MNSIEKRGIRLKPSTLEGKTFISKLKLGFQQNRGHEQSVQSDERDAAEDWENQLSKQDKALLRAIRQAGKVASAVVTPVLPDLGPKKESECK